MRIALSAAVGFFFGLESGYVLAKGMSETPQTWAVVSAILAGALLATIGFKVGTK
jgi:hypothetical protein